MAECKAPFLATKRLGCIFSRSPIMSKELKVPPNYYSYSANREVFKATRSTLQIFSKRLNNQLVETRELHITAVPESDKLRNKFGSINFRIVENTSENPIDKDGNPIVGGVNSFPEPVHVVLFVTPEAMALLNQKRTQGNAAGESVILFTIYPGTNILEWNREEAIPIYESNLIVEG